MRPLDPEDAPLLHRWIVDPDTRRFVQNRWPLMLPDEQNWIERVQQNKNGVTLMIVAPDGTPIGTMGIGGISWIDGTGVTGSMIGEHEYRGNGYGTDAKLALLECAFNTFGLRKIRASVYESNERSYRCLRRCGYEEEGRLYRERFIEGAYHDEILMAVHREQFEVAYEAHHRRMESAKCE